MSDVREQMVNAMIDSGDAYDLTAGRWRLAADAILERFNVIEKPVITDEALGGMAGLSAGGFTGDIEKVGQRMRDQLALSGLKIVRMEGDE